MDDDEDPMPSNALHPRKKMRRCQRQRTHKKRNIIWTKPPLLGVQNLDLYGFGDNEHERSNSWAIYYCLYKSIKPRIFRPSLGGFFSGIFLSLLVGDLSRPFPFRGWKQVALKKCPLEFQLLHQKSGPISGSVAATNCPDPVPKIIGFTFYLVGCCLLAHQALKGRWKDLRMFREWAPPKMWGFCSFFGICPEKAKWKNFQVMEKPSREFALISLKKR